MARAPQNAPRVGTDEAEQFVADLERRIAATEATMAEQLASPDEVSDFCMKTGLNALTQQLRKEVGSDLVYTKKPEPQKKPKKKRMRVAI